MRSDAKFLELLDAGDYAGAGTWLVHEFADEVLGVSVAMVRDRTLAEDMAQDVFGRAFAALPEYRREASPRTWLLRITKNRCIDHLRGANHEPRPEADDEVSSAPNPDGVPLPSDLIERRDEVERALTGLSEVERALVVLRFRHGLEYSELAMTFGIKEGTARMRLSRALAKMRAQLGPSGKMRAMRSAGASSSRRRKRAVASSEHPLTAYFRKAWGPISHAFVDRLLDVRA